MLFPKKTGALLLAAGAAWAYHKYNKMSAEQKQQFASSLKERGKRWMDLFSPRNAGSPTPPESTNY